MFPHATSVVLSGGRAPSGARKKDWRTAVLRDRGVELAQLATLDLIDAALAALTGLFALRGEFTALGDPEEGTIVVPERTLPERPYPRGGRRSAPRISSTCPARIPARAARRLPRADGLRVRARARREAQGAAVEARPRAATRPLRS